MTTSNHGIVILGGGICGIATAYYLGKAGIRSTVIERDGLAAHASGFAWGGMSGGIPNGPENPNHAVIQAGMRLHRELAQALLDEAKMDVQFQERHAIRIALNEHDVAYEQRGLAWKQAQPGYKVEWISGEDARTLEPRITPACVGALYIEGGSDVEPYRLTLGLAQAAERIGAVTRSATVTGFRVTGNRVDGVRLAGGDEVACETLVLAVGPWTEQVTEWLGAPLPVRPLKGQIIRLRATGDPYRYSIGHAKNYAMTKPADGLVWCGTTEEQAGFDEYATAEARDSIIDAALRMLPSLEESELVLQTACLRPVAPDNALVLGRFPGLDNVYVNTGAGRQGIMMGPAMGRAIADLIAHGKTDLDLTPYSPSRFTP